MWFGISAMPMWLDRWDGLWIPEVVKSRQSCIQRNLNSGSRLQPSRSTCWRGTPKKTLLPQGRGEQIIRCIQFESWHHPLCYWTCQEGRNQLRNLKEKGTNIDSVFGQTCISMHIAVDCQKSLASWRFQKDCPGSERVESSFKFNEAAPCSWIW